MMEEWKENTHTGSIAFLAIAVPLLIAISLIPSLFHIVSRMRENYQTKKGSPNKTVEGPRDNEESALGRSLLQNSMYGGGPNLNIN